MRPLPRWGSPVLAAAVLAAVVWRLGTGPFVRGVEAVDAGALLAAAAIVFVTTVCSAWRWSIVARGLGVPLRLPAAVAAYYRAVFLNLTLPSGLAGEVHRGLRHGRDAHDMSRAFRGVVWERTAGQVVQVVATVAVLLALPSPVRPAMPLVALAVVAIAAGLVLVATVRPPSAGSRWVRLRTAVVSDVRNGLLPRAAWPPVVLTSALVVAGHTLTFVIAARTAGVTASTVRVVPLALIALLAMVLPSVAGWGPREGVTAWVFAAAGLGADRGASAAVTYGVLVLVASLPGAVVLVAGWLPGRKASDARRWGAPETNARHMPPVAARTAGRDT